MRWVPDCVNVETGGRRCYQSAMEHWIRAATEIRTAGAALLLSALVALTAVAGCRDNGADDPAGSERKAIEAPGTRVQGSPGGVMVYIDPETGELRDTPAPGTEPVPGGDVRMPDRMIDGGK